MFFLSLFVIIAELQKRVRTRPSALGMSDPGVEPQEILEILELETPPYPRPPCRRLSCRLVRWWWVS